MRRNAFLTARLSGNIFLRYALAVAAVLITFPVSRALNPLVGNHLSYILLFPAVAFSGWYCGAGPSIVAMVLAIISMTYGTAAKVHSFGVPNTAEAIGILAFLLSAVLIVVMGEARRRQNEALRDEQSQLERKVRERTADLDAVNRNLRDLSARLMQLQDDERRRIARELHDSVGQMLAALTMNLSTVRADIERLSKTVLALTDSESLVQQMSTEVRTISHLLHPPLLDEAGLASALRWYVEGFAQRSGIKVGLDLPDDFGRLPSEAETAIFRVVQECLTNIHRHSESQIAKIRLRERDNLVLVEVEDQGKGIPTDKMKEMASAGTPGVGIRGMRERLRQLGGTLEIKSSETGTLVVVRLPVGETSNSHTFSVTDRPSPAAA
jgi:signal transduction histidine kinase